MLTQEIRQLIIDSCFKRPTQAMLDIGVQVHKLIMGRYPFDERLNNNLLWLQVSEDQYQTGRDYESGVGWPVYFNEHGKFFQRSAYEIESCDFENVGKSWFIAMSLRGPFVTGSAKVFRHVQGRKYKCCFYSPSEENKDMMDFCHELANKFGIYYVTYEDLCSIDFEATDEVLERFDEYIDRPNAFQMLFN